MEQPAAGLTAAMKKRIADRARQLKHELFDSYHPELHYMRGPGPKWREKHGLPPVEPTIATPVLTRVSKASA